MAPTNEERAAWAEKAINSVYEDDTEGNIGDILSDIMHLCHREGIDFEQKMITARSHFNTEAGYYNPPQKEAINEK